MALSINYVLAEPNVPQSCATKIYINNQCALLMANACQPTKRTKHIDTKHFDLQEWVEKDLVTLSHIPTSLNGAGTLAKCNPRILFHRHFDVLLGRIGQYLPSVHISLVRTFLGNEHTRGGGGGQNSRRALLFLLGGCLR